MKVMTLLSTAEPHADIFVTDCLLSAQQTYNECYTYPIFNNNNILYHSLKSAMLFQRTRIIAQICDATLILKNYMKLYTICKPQFIKRINSL